MNLITPNITDRLVEYFVVVGYGNKLLPLDSQWINDPFAPPPNIDDAFNPLEDTHIEGYAHELRYGINDYWGGPETDRDHPNATIPPDPAASLHHDKARPRETQREDMSAWPEERVEALITERLRVQESLLIQVQQHLFNADVLDRYPFTDTKHMPFPQGIPLFCMPEGGLRLTARSDIPKIYYFCCTLSNGDKLYGTCLSFLEPVPLPHIRGLLRRMEADEQNRPLWTSHVPSPLESPSGSSVSINAALYSSVVGLSAATVPLPVLERVRARTTEALERSPRLWSSRCLCVLSHFPFFPQYRIFLSELFRFSLSPMHVPLERYISLLVDYTPLPPSGVYTVQLNMGPYPHQPREDDEQPHATINNCHLAPSGIGSTEPPSLDAPETPATAQRPVLALDASKVLSPVVLKSLAPAAAAAIVEHHGCLELSSSSYTDLTLPPPPRCLVHSVALDTLPMPTNVKIVSPPPQPQPTTSRFSLSLSRSPAVTPPTPTSTSMSSVVFTQNPLLTNGQTMRGNASRVPMEPFSRQLTYPAPVSFRPLSFSRPPANLPLLPLAVSVHPLFRLLSIEHVVVIIEALLSERKVLILSERLSMLAPVCESLLLLLYPFKWPHVYIPLLPKVLNAFLHAPMPYLIGTHSMTYNNLDMDVLTDVVVVWLDKDQVDAEEMPLPLPARERQKLLKQLSILIPQFLSAARKDAAYQFVDSDDAFMMPPLPEDADDNDTAGIETFDGEERLPSVPELASAAAKGEYHVKRAFLRVFLSLFRSMYDYIPNPVDTSQLQVQWPQQPTSTGARYARTRIQEFDSLSYSSPPGSQRRSAGNSLNSTTINTSMHNSLSRSSKAGMPPFSSASARDAGNLSIDPLLSTRTTSATFTPENSFIVAQITESIPSPAVDPRFTTSSDLKHRSPDLRRSSSFSGGVTSASPPTPPSATLRISTEDHLDDPDQLFKVEAFLRSNIPARAFLEPFLSTQLWQTFIDERCSPALAARNAAHVLFFAESLTEKRNRSLFTRSRLTPFLDTRVATSVCTVLVASPQGLDRGVRHYNQYHPHIACVCNGHSAMCSYCSRALVNVQSQLRCIICDITYPRCTDLSVCLHCSCHTCPHNTEKTTDIPCSSCRDTSLCPLPHLAQHTHTAFLDRVPYTHPTFPRLSPSLFPSTAARVPRIISLDGALVLMHAQLQVGVLACCGDHPARGHVLDSEQELLVPLRKPIVDALLPLLAEAPNDIVAWNRVKSLSLVFRWGYTQTTSQQTIVIPCRPLQTSMPLQNLPSLDIDATHTKPTLSSTSSDIPSPPSISSRSTSLSSTSRHVPPPPPLPPRPPTTSSSASATTTATTVNATAISTSTSAPTVPPPLPTRRPRNSLLETSQSNDAAHSAATASTPHAPSPDSHNTYETSSSPQPPAPVLPATCAFIWLGALAPIAAPPASLTDASIAAAADAPMQVALSHLAAWVRSWFKKGQIPNIETSSETPTTTPIRPSRPNSESSQSSTSTTSSSPTPASNPSTGPTSPTTKRRVPPPFPVAASIAPNVQAALTPQSRSSATEDEGEDVLQPLPTFAGDDEANLLKTPGKSSMSAADAMTPVPAVDKSIAFLSPLSAVLSSAGMEDTTSDPMGLSVSVPELAVNSTTRSLSTTTSTNLDSVAPAFDGALLLIPFYIALLACSLSGRAPEATRTPGTVVKPVDLSLRKLHRLFIPNWINECVGRQRYDTMKTLLRLAMKSASEQGVLFSSATSNIPSAAPAQLPFSPNPNANTNTNPSTPTAAATATASTTTIATAPSANTTVATTPTRSSRSASITTPHHLRTRSFNNPPATPQRPLGFTNSDSVIAITSAINPQTAPTTAATLLANAISGITFSCSLTCTCGADIDFATLVNSHAALLNLRRSSMLPPGSTHASPAPLLRQLSLSHHASVTPPLSAKSTTSIPAITLDSAASTSTASTHPTNTAAATAAITAAETEIASESLIQQRVRMLSVINPDINSRTPPPIPARTQALTSQTTAAGLPAHQPIRTVSNDPSLAASPSSSATYLSTGLLFPSLTLVPVPATVHPSSQLLAVSDLYSYTQMPCPTCGATVTPSITLTLSEPVSPATQALTESLASLLATQKEGERYKLTLPLLPAALLAQELAKLTMNRHLDYFLGTPFRSQHPLLFFNFLWWCSAAGLEINEIWKKHTESAVNAAGARKNVA